METNCVKDEVFSVTNGRISDLKIDVFHRELCNDPDRDFIIQGVAQGFSVTDNFKYVKSVESKNHPSAVNNQDKVEQQIKVELSQGRYVKVKAKPTICSPLAAISKPDGSVRLLTDASKPDNYALNDYAFTNVQVKYQSVQDAIGLLKPGSFCAKVDLKSAYRSVGVNPEMYHMCGIKWRFKGDVEDTYMVDTRLMMGASRSPSIFHRLSQCVKRCMMRRGYQVIAYLDDFLIVAEDHDTCLSGQHVLIGLLRAMGFAIAWAKVDGPAQSIVFLGVELNTVLFSVGLPEDKIKDFSQLLLKFKNMKRASLKQLQTLAGKLNWASQVIKCGRSYLRRVLDVMAPLQRNNHKARLSDPFRQDIEWWLSVLQVFPGKLLLHKPVVHVINIDACTEGGGFIWGQDWGYVHWKLDEPRVTNWHINCKETLSAVFAARRWAPFWKDSIVIFVTDNQSARSWIEKGTVKNPYALPQGNAIFISPLQLRDLFRMVTR